MKIIFNNVNNFILIIAAIFLLKPLYAYAGFTRFLSVVGSIVPESDTIFFAKTNGYKTIDNGFITDSGESLSIIIVQMEVVKVLRGNIKPGEKHLVCTWFYPGDPELGFTYGRDGDEITVLGTKTPFNIQLPMLHYYYLGGFSYASEIKKALKLPKKPIKDKSRIFKTFSRVGDKIIRNACNEPGAWRH